MQIEGNFLQRVFYGEKNLSRDKESKVAFFLDYHFFEDHIAPPFLRISTNVFLQRIGKKII